MDLRILSSKCALWIVASFLCLFESVQARAEVSNADPNIPQNLTELNRWYVEPATNGAGHFLKAYQIFSNNVPLVDYYTNDHGQIGAFIDWPFLAPTNLPLSRAQRSALAPFNRAMKIAWRELEQGAKCGAYRYPVDLTYWWNVDFHHLRVLSGNSMGCQLRAVSESDAGFANAAVDSVLMGLAVAQSLKSEPLPVSQQVRGSMLTRAVWALEQVIQRTAVPTNRLETLQDAFNQIEAEETKGDAFERGLVGLKLIENSYFDASSNQLSEIATAWVTNDLQQIPQLIATGWKTREADRKLLADTCDQVLTIWKQGHPKRLEIGEILKTRYADLAQRQLWFKAILNMAGPSFALEEGATIARLRLAKIAIALERYRARHQNRYPDSLNALIPDYLADIPADIFSDAPLQYHRRGDGYLLYSIGRDRKDDGGSRKDDIIFETIHLPGRAIIE